MQLLASSFFGFLVLAASASAQLKPVYECCRYPQWPTTVLNFEYPDWNPDHTTYHGLTWRGWAGYHTHPGYTAGWAPIPSNHTTMAAKAGPGAWTADISSGSHSFYDVHSLWFNYYELPPKLGVTNIVFQGYYQGNWVQDHSVPVTVVDDNEWRHVCFNWTDKTGSETPVDRLVVILPDCVGRRCESKWFEVDDVWVRGKGGRGLKERKGEE